MSLPESAPERVAVIGAGLAGCECAAALSRQGIGSALFEMKPERFSPAHGNPGLAELVCSNSLRSADPLSAVGLLKEEMRALGSLTLRAADACRVPAGKALAVDRDAFSRAVTEAVELDPRLRLVRREIRELRPDREPALRGFSRLALAAGPLATPELSAALAGLTGAEHLYFYDAIAPIVSGESLNMERIFPGSRYNQEEEDYLNCPLSREEYDAFYQALLEAQKTPARAFERELHFEGCMPVEVLAGRGEKTLLFGPFKPVGLRDPRSGKRPFALVQLRAETLNREMFNLVGCQTKLTQPEQERVFRLIPGLERAEFVRYGSMHRNTYVNAPLVLNPDLSLRAAPHIFLAGQLTGVEGYVESAACGLWLGLSLGAALRGAPLPLPPGECALGALLGHLRGHPQTRAGNFQPSNVQYGLTPELGKTGKKSSRKELYAQRAAEAFARWREEAGL
jgi:methylenetetrahydrofolate--tRNA-(uracil-5-)-methyltransferase